MKTGLIIEDNEDNHVLISRLLTKANYNTLIAESGTDGIETAIKEKPDFILLDIQLPDIDGTEVLKRLREIECFESTPIIAVTSYAMAGDREHLLSIGCNGYLEKPINPSTFISQIKKLIEE